MLKGFWFQKEAYTYIHMNIYRKSGGDFCNFLPKKLLSYESMKRRLFQMVSFQNEAYQSAVGSCPDFLLDFLLHRFLWQKRRV